MTTTALARYDPVKMAPTDVQREIVSQLRLLGVGLHVNMRTEFPNGQPMRRVPGRVTVRIRPGLDRPAAQRQALALLDEFSRPATQDRIEEWLAMLDAITASRRRDVATAELALAVYAAKLSQFPADVVHHALLETSWTFFPALAELEEECERLAAPRLAMRYAILKPWADEGDQPAPRKPGAEKRVDALVADALVKLREAERIMK